MYVVVSYDVAGDRRRRKIAKVMESFGTRKQYSVFDCTLDEGRLQKMKKKLNRLLKPEQDSIRIYRICERCRSSIEIMGTGTIKDDEDLVLL